MKFKTFDFEGTKIRIGINEVSNVMLVAEDISRLLGYTGTRDTLDMLNAATDFDSGTETGLYVHRSPGAALEFAHVINIVGAIGAVAHGDCDTSLSKRFMRWLTHIVIPMERDGTLVKLTNGYGVGSGDFRVASIEDTHTYIRKWLDEKVVDAFGVIQNLERSRVGYIKTNGPEAFSEAEKSARKYLKARQEYRAELHATLSKPPIINPNHTPPTHP